MAGCCAEVTLLRASIADIVGRRSAVNLIYETEGKRGAGKMRDVRAEGEEEKFERSFSAI